MRSLSLRARWVAPVARPPIDGGYVSIVDGRIAVVDRGKPADGEAVDLGDAVLLPGLINAHTHLEFSGLARPLGTPGTSLPEWIRGVIADRKRGDRDAASSIAAGLRESAANGVTTVGEIATAPADAYRATASVSPTIVQFQEAIGFSAGRIDSVYQEVVRRFESAPAPAGVSPHAPYTVHPKLLNRLIDLASERNAPAAMHLAESREELELLATGGGQFRDLLEERSMWDDEAIPRDSRPLDYLRRLSRAPRSLVIHGNYLDDEEIAFAGAHREQMSVVYCPRTHAYFRHQSYPFERMLKAGVRVVFGTDSRASNPNLNLLEEMRFVHAARPELPPADLVRMATLDAAEALGLAGDRGALEVGKRADLVAMPCSNLASHPYAALLEGGEPPTGVWIGGTSALFTPT